MMSRGRLKLVPECDSVSAKKRVAYPSRSTPSMARRPTPLTSMIAPRSNKLELRREIAARILERDRTVRLAPHELVHERIRRSAHLRGSAMRDHLAFRQVVNVIDDVER